MSQVIVAGGGQWGQNLIRNFAQLGALGGIVEINPQLREQLQQTYPDVPLYSAFEDALATNIEAIVIATPAPSHFSLAQAALQQGKHVFIEKPMTLSQEDAKALATYADAHHQIVMVGHLLLYQPAIVWLRNYLISGQGGQVLHIATHRLNLGKVRTTESVWWSLAPHDIAVILDLLDRPVVGQIQAIGHRRLQAHLEDEVHVSLAFASGQTAQIHCSWQWPLKQRGTVVITDQKMLVYDEISQQITIHHKSIDQTLTAQDNGVEVIPVADGEPLRLECQHFLDCIAHQKQPHSDAWNGVAVVTILEQVEKLLRP